jgi:hypothetical protein
MHSAPHHARFQVIGTNPRRVVAPSLIVLIVVVLGVVAGISSLLKRPPAHPEIHFQDKNDGSSLPLGMLGTVPLPPSL